MRKAYLISLLLILALSSTTFALTLQQGYTAVITSTGAPSGVPPYTYQWFSQCPSCGSFSAIPGATYTTYFFDTNSLTEEGTWQFQLQGKDSVGAVVNSVSTNNVIVVNSIIVGGCIPLINANSVIAFPETVPGSFAPTSNVVNIGNAGTATSNILIEGGNWISGTSSFLVGNTLWSATSGGNIGTQLSNTAVDTQIIIPAGDSNSIYFGLNVPTGQAAGTYSQTINALTSC
jgi:hypothetical protein